MGGFALEANLCEEQFLPDGVVRVGLTAEGLKFLAMHAPEIIPNLPRLSEIKDKSKASSASKVIACMQVLWFCLQCFERSIRTLPITLFEVATMAHCVYALIIQYLWWGKPFSVGEPTTRVISGEKMSAILSYLWMSSDINCISRDSKHWFPEFESMQFYPDLVDREASPATPSFCHHSDTLINGGAALPDISSSPSHTRPTNSTILIVNTSASNAERGPSDPASALENCGAEVTPRTPASVFIYSQ
jgi:hypothetical protein